MKSVEITKKDPIFVNQGWAVLPVSQRKHVRSMQNYTIPSWLVLSFREEPLYKNTIPCHTKQIFTPDGFVASGAFRLPLYHDQPTKDILDQLSMDPTADVMKKNIAAKRVKYLENASIVVRLSDSRLADALPYENFLDESNVGAV